MQEKVDIVKGKIEKNKTVPYYFLASIFVLGALFFSHQIYFLIKN